MSYAQPTNEMIEQARHANLSDYFRNNGYDMERRRNEFHVNALQWIFAILIAR